MPRLFTVEEANALIPTLGPALADLIDKREEVKALRRRLAAAEVAGRSNGRESQAAAAGLRRDLEHLLSDMNARVDEISALGCELKDMAHGLVDFPSLREGRPVYLCWRLGEERVTHWHEPETGFAGRQPL